MSGQTSQTELLAPRPRLKNVRRGAFNSECALRVTPEMLRARAAALADEAARLHRRADDAERALETRDRHDRVKRAVTAIAADAWRGATLAALADQLHAEIAEDAPWIDDEGCRQLLLMEIAHNARARAAMRNREIVRLALAGWDNAKLAGKFNLSKKHVSRLVAGALRGGFGIGWNIETPLIVPRSGAHPRRVTAL